MKLSQQFSQGRDRKRGFALTVTLSLMVLLTVIAVGMLTLAGISQRTSSRDAAQAVAKSNARMALMIAIGDLQKALGPDQRISAKASVVMDDPTQPNMVGAWESFGWQAPSGNPPDPAEKASKFRRWLVSSAVPAAQLDRNFPAAEESSDGIWLTNPATTGTLGQSGAVDAANPKMWAERVPVRVGHRRGGFAWMVADNSTAVPLNLAPNNSEELAQNIANRTAASAPRLDVIADGSADPHGLQELAGVKNRRDLVSMQTAVLALTESGTRAKAINARSQSLTTASTGLLTDTVNGGLKIDLTPLMEAGPGNNPDGAADSDSPYFKPEWGAPTWAYLRDHYQKYKSILHPDEAMPRYSLKGSDDMNPDLTVGEGFDDQPLKETLVPVVAKLQIVYSLVSHQSHLGDRIKALNNYGSPRGSRYHAVPHLVYDPIVTLYNPYDVALDLERIRIRIWDAPVGFQFQKHDKVAKTESWFRPEFARGEFHGLGRFQKNHESDSDARKYFTLILQNMDRDGHSLGNLVLAPGEVRVFSPRVGSDWTWNEEVSGGGTPRTFFDWNSDLDFGNRDRRGSGNLFGVESIPGINFRAGLQTDHLSYEKGRDPASMYAFELDASGNPRDGLGQGWVSMRMGVGSDRSLEGTVYGSDEILVNCKPVRTVTDPQLPDFKVDILAGAKQDVQDDILRSYEFRLGDVAAETSTTGNPEKPITREFRIFDLYQDPDDRNDYGGKSPFAVFTMTAKTTLGTPDGKAWLFNNLVTTGARQDNRWVGNAAQSYDLRLEEVSAFSDIHYEESTGRGYFGADSGAGSGSTMTPMYRIPLTPAASLGDWIASNLVSSSRLPRVNYPLGNSYAHPLISSDAISEASPVSGADLMLDHSYLMNATFWDRYYFSSATAYDAAIFNDSRSQEEVLEEFFSGQSRLLNGRLIPYLTGAGNAASEAATFAELDPQRFSEEFATKAMVEGVFNINSDSVDAWRAVLSSMRDAKVAGYGQAAGEGWNVDGMTAFPRAGLPIGSSADGPSPQTTTGAVGQLPWACFRALSDDQIKELAIEIVKEIRIRGKMDGAPSLCLADFINRRIGSASDHHAQKGILQTAIDQTSINSDFHQRYSNSVNSDELSGERIRGLANPDALAGKTADGAAPILSQGDVLTALAPFITARGDTFTIRAYGEARDASGTTVEARAWCEATLQRTPEYVDPRNAADAHPEDLTIANREFGRRFRVISFRWLNAAEI